MLVYRFNEKGEFVEPVELLPESDGTYTVPNDCTVEELPQPNWEPIFDGTKWIETVNIDEVMLKEAKRLKDAELNKACKESILAGFSHEINGITYWFSYDSEAQQNYSDARAALKDNIVQAVPFTAKLGGKDGKYVRINIDMETFQGLALTILNHKVGNQSHYRDVLMPIVDSITITTTLEDALKQIEAVTW